MYVNSELFFRFQFSYQLVGQFFFVEFKIIGIYYVENWIYICFGIIFFIVIVIFV